MIIDRVKRFYLSCLKTLKATIFNGNYFELSTHSLQRLNKIVTLLNENGGNFAEVNDINLILVAASCESKKIRIELKEFYRLLSPEDRKYLLEKGVDLNMEKWVLSDHE